MNKEFVPKRYNISKIVFFFSIFSPLVFWIIDYITRWLELGLPPTFTLIMIGFVSGIIIKRFRSKTIPLQISLLMCLFWVGGSFLSSFLLMPVLDILGQLPKGTDVLRFFLCLSVIPALFCALGMSAKGVFGER